MLSTFSEVLVDKSAGWETLGFSFYPWHGSSWGILQSEGALTWGMLGYCYLGPTWAGRRGVGSASWPHNFGDAP